MTTCRHCDRTIVPEDGGWIDPEATGDDSVWRETCDQHDTFIADHEPDYGTVSEFKVCEVCGAVAAIDFCAHCGSEQAGDGIPDSNR